MRWLKSCSFESWDLFSLKNKYRRVRFWGHLPGHRGHGGKSSPPLLLEIQHQARSICYLLYLLWGRRGSDHLSFLSSGNASFSHCLLELSAFLWSFYTCGVKQKMTTITLTGKYHCFFLFCSSGGPQGGGKTWAPSPAAHLQQDTLDISQRFGFLSSWLQHQIEYPVTSDVLRLFFSFGDSF